MLWLGQSVRTIRVVSRVNGKIQWCMQGPVKHLWWKFCRNSKRLLTLNNYCGKAPSQRFLLMLAYQCNSHRVSGTLVLFTAQQQIISVLTLSWWRPLSYGNQSIDLLRKSMEWFLFDNGLRHERVKNVGKANKFIFLTPHFVLFSSINDLAWKVFFLVLRFRFFMLMIVYFEKAYAYLFICCFLENSYFPGCKAKILWRIVL